MTADWLTLFEIVYHSCLRMTPVAIKGPTTVSNRTQHKNVSHRDCLQLYPIIRTVFYSLKYCTNSQLHSVNITWQLNTIQWFEWQDSLRCGTNRVGDSITKGYNLFPVITTICRAGSKFYTTHTKLNSNFFLSTRVCKRIDIIYFVQSI